MEIDQHTNTPPEDKELESFRLGVAGEDAKVNLSFILRRNARRHLISLQCAISLLGCILYKRAQLSPKRLHRAVSDNGATRVASMFM
jgi:hypothetical protein